jgi:iron complex outermembrane receptor protein
MIQPFSHVSFRHALKSFTAISLVASGVAGIGAPAKAQDNQATNVSMAIEEITVTARRREENIQSVPISITAFSAETLREKNITTSRQLAELTPTYTENPVYGRDAGGFDRIRGLPGVRSYFAEAPTTASANQGGVSGRGAFQDLENVQVLVGPQGTLFGINAIGGAILREPKRPTDVLEGSISAGYGTYNHRFISGVLNVPAGDKVAMRFAGTREVRDGFTRILNTGLKVDDINYTAIRFGLTVKPFENLESYTVVDARVSETNGPSRFVVAVRPGSFAALVGGPTYVNSVAAQAALGKSTQIGASSAANDTFEHSKYLLVVNNTKWDLSDALTIKNIFSYSSINNVERYDWDGTASNIIDPYADSRAYPAAQVSYSEELQVQGRFLDGKINAVVGGFASYDGYPNARRTCYGLRIFGGLPGCTLNDGITRSQGIFGQATVNMAIISPALEKLNLTAGYRYNWDYQKQKTQVTTRAGACSSVNANPATCYIVQSNNWTAPGWTFGFDYQLQPNRMVYVTASRAYSRGSFNNVDLPPQLRIVEPQFNTNLEGGIKADWDVGNTRLRTNASVFHNWFDNVQENVTGSYVDAQGNQRIAGVLLNAAKVHVIGAELALQWAISEQFELSGAYAYSHAKYVRYDTVNPTTGAPESFTNRRFPFHAEHSGNATLKYIAPLDPSVGKVSVSAIATLTSDEVPLDDGSPVQPFNRSKLDLRADWNDVYGYPVDLSLSATNVTNSRYSLIGFNLYQTIGILTTNYSEPRMVTASVRYRF